MARWLADLGHGGVSGEVAEVDIAVVILLNHGSGIRVQGSGFRVQDLGFRVQGSGCMVQGSGFRV